MTDSASSTRPEDARTAALKVVRQLVDAGHVAYFAGGCVRDELLGHAPLDYDVATDAVPDRVAELFPRHQRVGESFGVMLVRTDGHMLQVATFRRDGPYSDSRRPDRVVYTDAKHDALRRDFTINGMFQDPLEDRIIDYVGGQADIDAKLVRAIGDPADRLHEDHLRALRAVRFAARYGFSIEADTAAAIERSASALKGVSRERIGQEIKRMLMDANRAVAAWELQYLGLDAPVLQEPSTQVAPRRLGRLVGEPAYATAVAGWLLDRHPDTDEVALLDVARSWSKALMLSNDDKLQLRQILEAYLTLGGPWSTLGVARQKRLAASDQFEQALALVQATDPGLFVDLRRHVTELAKTQLAPPPLVNGEDLIEAGFEPGPVFKRLLEAVYDAQLEGAVLDKAEALALATAIARTEQP
jgi:tRNA nucleotidyltransferase/poly(A) polymerase